MTTHPEQMKEGVLGDNLRLLFLSVVQDHNLMSELSKLANDRSFSLDVVSSFSDLDLIDFSHYEAAIIDIDSISETCERKVLQTVRRRMNDLAVVLTGSRPNSKQEIPDYVDAYVPKTFGAIAVLDSTIELVNEDAGATLDADDFGEAFQELSRALYLEELQSISFWR